MPRFTSIETEDRLAVEKLDREHKNAIQVTRRRRLQQLGYEAILDNAEGTLQVSQEILSKLVQQENKLLKLSETNISTEGATKELKKAKAKAYDPLRKMLAR